MNNFYHSFIPDLLTAPQDKITQWLSDEIGGIGLPSQPPNAWFFHLLQIPSEFAEFLVWLRDRNITSILELGSYEGGTIALMSFFLQNRLKTVHSVDLFDLGLDRRPSLTMNLLFAKSMLGVDVRYFTMTTDLYFLLDKQKFDLVFIDANHSYENAKRDFENARLCLNVNGFIVLHDVNSITEPGTTQLWQEIKNSRCKEIFHSNECGIGIWQE